MNDDTKALIGAGIRTNLVALPSIPGLPNFAAMIEQGWSEYENHQFQNRVGEFFTEIKSRFESLEALQTGDLGRTLALEAQIALLEETVTATSHEPLPEKRKTFADFYVSAVVGKQGNDADYVRSLLQQLESLTLSDLEVLRKFRSNGSATGQMMAPMETNSEHGDPFRFLTNDAQEKFLAPLKLSIIKLETRGLILKELHMDGGGFIDDGKLSALAEFHKEIWHLTYLGRQLLSAISDH
jgi:hypothetical protein